MRASSGTSGAAAGGGSALLVMRTATPVVARTLPPPRTYAVRIAEAVDHLHMEFLAVCRRAAEWGLPAHLTDKWQDECRFLTDQLRGLLAAAFTERAQRLARIEESA